MHVCMLIIQEIEHTCDSSFIFIEMNYLQIFTGIFHFFAYICSMPCISLDKTIIKIIFKTLFIRYLLYSMKT